ncbi:MAG: ABC transporter permease [Paracoccus sp. (in: a-proteobacteria)]|uniref:ABC transporter permease n=1 Tax=Paracoccus sp. TaxID=267 RepID=UPI0039E2A46E
MIQRGKLALMLSAIVLVGVFFILPLGMAFYQSLKLDGAWSLRNYADLFTVPFSRSIWTTLSISVATTVITILVSIPACNFVASKGGRFGSIFFAGMALAFTLSILTRTLAWQILLARNGFVNTLLMQAGLTEKPLDLLYTRGAVLVAMVQVFIPYAAMVLYAGMRGIDRSLIMASRTLGASAMQTFWHAYWPQFKGSLVLAVMIVFAGCVGSFVVPSVLGGPDDTMFGQLMNNALVNDSVNGAGRASAAGVLMMLFLTVVLLIGLRIIGTSPTNASPLMAGGRRSATEDAA